ncbi:hypothetical protein RchiOBHm_Chr1g0326701 [Rosa chinensis]|uniref:Uncharacterized protein n=1 Tax=Rosa chinensis TaxID=74649 RepID=A0A2P6SAD8_ROSCH|nr:hypothetical protein RchiOBHm_Chr2g0127921 [Rosa chinensis]PRQ55629.1 hypothetical protein RchiOBHm_Chr1g0326701 [Rosa chinensis]
MEIEIFRFRLGQCCELRLDKGTRLCGRPIVLLQALLVEVGRTWFEA